MADWTHAEGSLDELGLGKLADPHELRLDYGGWLRVRIAEVSPVAIRMKKDNWGDMNAPQAYYLAAARTASKARRIVGNCTSPKGTSTNTSPAARSTTSLQNSHTLLAKIQ